MQFQTDAKSNGTKRVKAETRHHTKLKPSLAGRDDKQMESVFFPRSLLTLA
jgi:hypothetical protein